MSTASRSRVVRWVALGAVALAVVVVGAIGIASRPTYKSANALATNPDLDPGTSLTGQAPSFTLTDQYGRPVSLQSFRGRVVILAFNDSQCTTICPLTTTAMVQAKSFLGPAAAKVELLGIDANPTATTVKDVRAYSEAHGMMHQWLFATGSKAQLARVWHAYHIDVAIEQGQIDHTPAVFVIGPDGRLEKLYETQQAYAAVGQLAQLLAAEAARLLPGHPRVNSNLSYVRVAPLSPATAVTVASANEGTVTLGVPARRGCCCSSRPGTRRSRTSLPSFRTWAGTRHKPPGRNCRP